MPEDEGISEYVAAVFEMLLHDPASTLFSHLTMAPVYPERVMVPVVSPGQRGVVPPEIVPPTEGGVTTIALGVEKAEEQTPLCTSARYSQVPAEGGVSL